MMEIDKCKDNVKPMLTSINKGKESVKDWRSKPRRKGGGRKRKVDEAFRRQVVDGSYRVIKAYADSIHSKISDGSITDGELQQAAKDLQAFVLKTITDHHSSTVTQLSANMSLDQAQIERLLAIASRNSLIYKELEEERTEGTQAEGDVGHNDTEDWA